MKHIFILAAILLTHTTYCQNSPKSGLNEVDWIIGTWKGSNKNLKPDGSGEYDESKNLTIKVNKILGGYGHAADWYGPDGSYWGTTLRNYDLKTKTWKEQWFNHIKTIWEDEHYLKWDGEKLIMEKEGVKDQFGTYSVKRTHQYDEVSNTYSYKHFRKYSNMNDWLLIDSFSIKKITSK